MKRICLSILLVAGVASASVQARAAGSPAGSAGIAGDDSNYVYQIHDNGYLRTTATNLGYFGEVDPLLVDSITGGRLPVFQSPAYSYVEYLWDAGLWIGGIVGTDTLVSTGTSGFVENHELFADAPAPPAYSDARGDVEWTFVYSDTTTDPETVRDDRYDGPHRPLPVRVRQKTYTFAAAPAKNGLFIEITIRNTGTATITGLCVGWMFDADVGFGENGGAGSDDITGFVRRQSGTGEHPVNLSAAWAMDNDGDPDTTSHQFGSESADGMFLSMFLGSTPPLTDESYNWWRPGANRTFNVFDWGPQRAPGDTSVIGGHGLAATDRFRYRLMSNRESDYPSPYAAVDSTSGGWIPPTVDSIARSFADGTDIRFLHSAGAIDLQPGDSIVTHWVWIVRARAMNGPTWFAQTFDAGDPDLYMQGLRLSNVWFLLEDIRTAWDSAFVSLPIPPPHGVHISGWDDTSGVLSWNRRGTERLQGYRVRRFTLDAPSVDTTMMVIGDTSFIDAGLDRSRTYYYTVASVANTGIVGAQSPADSLLPDRPKAPRRPTTSRRSGGINVSWPAVDDSDLGGYRVYRRTAGEDWSLLAETEDGLTYSDESVETALIYEYRITALSANHNESFPSPSATGITFAFDGPPQILNYTSEGPTSLTDRDSVGAAWMRILAGAEYVDATVPGPPYSINDFDPHPVTVVVSDGRASLSDRDMPLLSLYAGAQGATIISGRDLFNENLLFDTLVKLDTGSIGYKAGITHAYYPRVLLANPTRMNADFAGAAPVDWRLPRLTADPSRTGWGLNPLLPPPGDAIPFVGYFEIDTARAEVIYTFESRFGDESPLNGKPVAIVPRDTLLTVAVFAFPLSYIREDQARRAVTAVLERFGYGSTVMIAGDANDDGEVGAADIGSLIDYLYHGGDLRSAVNADLNGDCRVDLIDVVILMDHVHLGTALPMGSCEP